MAPATPVNNPSNGMAALVGPHPSHIHVANQYSFHQQLSGAIVATGANPTREDTFRLQGIEWINEVRAVLQL